MPSFSNHIAENLQPLCRVYIGKSVDPKVKNTINIFDILKNECLALIDTGANRSAISDRFAQKLSLEPIGNSEVVNTSGTVRSSVYEICVYIPSVVDKKQHVTGQQTETVEMKGFVNQRVNEVRYNSNNSFDIIIGMDIITKGHLTIVGNLFHFSY